MNEQKIAIQALKIYFCACEPDHCKNRGILRGKGRDLTKSYDKSPYNPTFQCALLMLSGDNGPRFTNPQTEVQ